MPLTEICRHLERLSSAFRTHEPDPFPVGTPRRSYQFERLRQNLRLDLPSLGSRDRTSFHDGQTYPADYPIGCGPNVAGPIEQLFLNQVISQLIELRKVLASLDPRDVASVEETAILYVHKMSVVWGSDQYGNISSHHNRDNSALPGSMPAEICRYVDLKTFLKYALLPHFTNYVDAPDEFLASLADASDPDAHRASWETLRTIWSETRERIKAGTLTFHLRRLNYEREVKFCGDGGSPVHRSSSFPEESSDTLKHVIRELALPGWETENQRRDRLGLVYLTCPASGLEAYRPTILDQFSAGSYFFLPRHPGKREGQTWRLTDCLCYNHQTDHNGEREWTIHLPPEGIPCVRIGAPHQPTFSIAGLAQGALT